MHGLSLKCHGKLVKTWKHFKPFNHEPTPSDATTNESWCDNSIENWERKKLEMQFSASTSSFADPFKKTGASILANKRFLITIETEIKQDASLVRGSVFHLACFKLEKPFRNKFQVYKSLDRDTCKHGEGNNGVTMDRRKGWTWKLRSGSERERKHLR